MFLINISEFIYFWARIILNLTIGFNNASYLLAFTPFLLLTLLHASENRIENSEHQESMRVVTWYLGHEYDKISNIAKIGIVENKMRKISYYLSLLTSYWTYLNFFDLKF